MVREILGRVLFVAWCTGLPWVSAHGAEVLPSDGAAIFKQCAACHLPSGEGVPGVFPPLRSELSSLAAEQRGRRYLVLAVLRGVSGPITVEGRHYSGFMPAHSGLSDEAVAAVLNVALSHTASAGTKIPPFASEEVTRIRADGEDLSSQQVADIRKAIRQ